MKKRTINSKIQKPFLIIMIVIPLVTLLVFNFSMRLYVNKRAAEELKNAIRATQTIAGTVLTDAAADDAAGLAKVVGRLRTAVRLSSYSVDTEILLFNRNDKLLYPLSLSEHGISAALFEKIENRILFLDNSKTVILSAEGKKYVVSGYQVGEQVRSFRLVFVVSMSGADSMIRMMNIILIAVMLAGIAVGIFMARHVASRIAAPVTGLCSMAEQIGKGGSMPEPIQTEISELAELSAGIQDMAGRLDAYDRSRKDFLQNASHELRTPLMSIQGYAEGIASGVVPDVAQAARIIGEESIRLNALVEELLTLSRIENQTYSRQMQTLNAGDLLQDYIQRLGGYANKMGKELLVLPHEKTTLTADESLFARIVMNVASNGLRYAKKTVKISLYTHQEWAVIRIADDGPGIDPTDLPRLFERFYKGKGGNFGLGLSIAQSAAEWMGGSIRAFNAPEGAVFEIWLRSAT